MSDPVLSLEAQNRVLLGKTILLRVFASLNLPMLSLARPHLVELSARRVAVSIPLCRRNRSFRNALAFGPILMGAECAAGFLFGEAIQKRKTGAGFVVTKCEANLKKSFKSSGRFVASIAKSADYYLDQVSKSKRSVSALVKVDAFDSQANLCAVFKFEVKLQPPRNANAKRVRLKK